MFKKVLILATAAAILAALTMAICTAEPGYKTNLYDSTAVPPDDSDISSASITSGPISSTPASSSLTSYSGSDVNLTVDPSYLVTIPDAVTLDSFEASGGTTYSGYCSLTAQYVTLPYGKNLTVRVNSANDFRLVTAEGAQISYTAWNIHPLASSGYVNNGDAVAKINAGNVSDTFGLEYSASVPVYAGEYHDYLTFIFDVQ